MADNQSTWTTPEFFTNMVNKMRKNMDDQQTVKCLCTAILYYCNENNLQKLADAGAREALVLALDTWGQKDQAVARSACRALCYFP